MKFTSPVVLSIVCLLSSHQALAETLHKWKDAKGITHFSEHPPINQKSETIKPKTGHSDPVTYPTTPPPSAPASNPADAAKEALHDPERCASARKNQETLTTFGRIKIMGDNGEYHYLTPEEQKQKMDEANLAISESCVN